MAAEMATGDALERALRPKIREYVDMCVYESARFLAERLVAHRRSEENLHELATCYVRSGQLNRAIAVLAGAQREENRYLLAVCCFQQGKLTEAEDALLQNEGGRDTGMFGDDKDGNIPMGAAGLYLMGRICKRGNRREQAVDYFVKSLEMDPFLWSAFEELCDLGANIEASRFFGSATYFERDLSDDPTEVAITYDESHLNDNSHDSNENNNAGADESSSEESFSTPRPRSLMELTSPSHNDNGTPIQAKPGTTKPPYHLAFKTPVSDRDSSEVVKKPRVGGVHNMIGVAAPNNKPRRTLRRPLADSEEKGWRHGRLSFSSTFEDSPLLRKNDHSGRQLLFESSIFRDEAQGAAITERQRQQGEENLRRLLSSFGSIYQRVSAYMCLEALEMLERLPHSQRTSGWSLQQKGRAYFEMADYDQAQDTYRVMFRNEPYRMEGLDLYSTALWHLKNEVELSYLAQQVTDFDRLSREAWCVAGNCFSLQKEHDTALTFFQRAIQLDPTYTYAYTLAGHEYVSNEDFDKAINCYRHAIRTDARHYNAWYGLGTIYYRQEKFEFAEYHFQRALEVNPRSSLLHCFLGMVLHAMHRFDEALAELEMAGELQPKNPQARFQRANVLITQQRFEEALEELRVVRTFAPRESSVHFMMGRVAKRLGRREDALRYFTAALYFHPKDNNLIRAAIDKINEPDFDDEERL